MYGYSPSLLDILTTSGAAALSVFAKAAFWALVVALGFAVLGMALSLPQAFAVGAAASAVLVARPSPQLKALPRACFGLVACVVAAVCFAALRGIG